MIPIGSLDGGNLLKSIIWHFSGSKNKGRNFLNKVNLKLTNDEIVQHLKNSFVKNKSNINFKNIAIDNKK